MSYFNINIDNDITYLLKEIGRNIKVNNIPTRAIINNSSMERSFDDKRIITHQELKRGQYINYNDLFFILLNEVNDKRYLTYYKGIMRRCNFEIKFIVDDRLFLFPSIVESENMYLSDSNLMATLKHTLTVTLPLTSITRQLKVEQSFMKWGQKWQIQGRDYTKDGLLILNCERTGSSHNDDKVNEIADRFENDEDKLNGNIEPIPPFATDEPTDPEEPEPEEPETTYSIEVTKQYQGDTDFELSSNNWQTYTIKKIVGDAEMPGNFDFALSDDLGGLTLTKENNNSCKLSSPTLYGGEIDIKLLVTDSDLEEVVIEKTITIKRR